jgi:hypothetical protein
MMFVAILGTTITPYLFFWLASQEAEEDVAKGKTKEINEENIQGCGKKISSHLSPYQDPLFHAFPNLCPLPLLPPHTHYFKSD